jgi:hypothetical protein
LFSIPPSFTYFSYDLLLRVESMHKQCKWISGGITKKHILNCYCSVSFHISEFYSDNMTYLKHKVLKLLCFPSTPYNSLNFKDTIRKIKIVFQMYFQKLKKITTFSSKLFVIQSKLKYQKTEIKKFQWNLFSIRFIKTKKKLVELNFKVKWLQIWYYSLN